MYGKTNSLNSLREELYLVFKTVVTVVSYFGSVIAPRSFSRNLRFDDPKQKNVNDARVTQRLFIMVKTMLTINKYFGNETIVEKFTPGRSKPTEGNFS